MSRRARVPSQLITDDLLVGLCEGFIDEGWNANDASKWLKQQDPPLDVGRTRVYALLQEARDRGLFRLQVRGSKRLREQLADVTHVSVDHIRVVDASGISATNQVALQGADLTLEVVRRIARETDYDRLRIGLGGGRALRKLAAELATMLIRAPDRPPLAIHALSSGFDPREPQNVPVTFLGAFEPVAKELVGLFSSGMLERAEAERVRELPGVGESFQLAKKIDVVVTSLASARDRAGALNRFLLHAGHPALEESRRQLVDLGWVGDLLYAPYSDTGPIEADLPVQPVSVFTLRELRALARKDHKAVVLVVGPSESGRSKADALLPLIEQKSLRVWTDLVVDAATADQVLQQLAANRGQR